MDQDPTEAPKTHAKESHLFLLGNRGSGKTCFLCGLYEYGRAHQDSGISIVPLDTSTGRYLEEFAQFRAQGHWPPPTSGVSTLRLAIRTTGTRREFAARLEMVDYQGEDLKKRQVQSLDENPDLPDLDAVLGRSSGLIVLVDPTKDVLLDEKLLTVDEAEMQSRQDALIKTIGTEIERRAEKGGGGSGVNIMLVVPKTDLLSNDIAKDLQGLLRKNNQSFINALGAWTGGRSIKTLSVSAFGPINEDGSPPSQAQPCGFDAVLDEAEQWKWAAEKQRNIRKGVFAFAAVVILFIVALAWQCYRRTEIVYEIRTRPINELPEYIQGLWRIESKMPSFAIDHVNDRLAQERNHLKGHVDTDIEKLRARRGLARSISNMPGNRDKDGDDRVLNDIVHTLDDVIFARIRSRPSGDALAELCDEYLVEYPQGKHRAEVLRILDDIPGKRIEFLVAQIRTMPIRNRQQLRDKSVRIRHLLQQPQGALIKSGLDPRMLDRACELAEGIAGASEIFIADVRVSLTGYGDRYQKLKWTWENGEVMHTHESERAGTSSYWHKPFPVDPGRNQRLDIVLDAKHRWRWKYSAMARRKERLYHLLSLLDGTEKISLDPDPNWPDATVTITGRLALRDGNRPANVEADKVRAFRSYITSNAGWDARR